jgi:hypothetical protein
MRLILLIGLIFLSGCLCKMPSASSPTTSSTQPCPESYIMVGSSCCLDGNGNGVCDNEEAETSTTEEPTTSTLEPTTSTAPSSTTLSSTTSTATTQSTTSSTMMCSANMDCGERIEERVCYNGDVYVKRTSPICSSPGTQKASCMTKVVMDPTPTERCGNQHCAKGKCGGA